MTVEFSEPYLKKTIQYKVFLRFLLYDHYLKRNEYYYNFIGGIQY